MENNIDKELKEFASVQAKRAPWEAQWELIARYVLMRKAGFVSTDAPGSFYVHGDVYDDTAPRALNQMVSALSGALWKNGARTFKIVKPEIVPETEQVKEYYTEINRRLVKYIEHPKAGFGSSWIEYLLENAGFGTAGLGVFAAAPGQEHKLEFKAFGLKNLYVIEDARGRVVKIYYKTQLTADQLVTEYGTMVLEYRTIKSAVEAMDFVTKFEVLWVIAPRAYIDTTKDNNKNMLYQSKHILICEKTVLRDSGFTSMPIQITRFYKNEGEEYGRSPAMEALPSIIELNALWEMITKSTEKNQNPPLYLLDDGSFAGGILDTSPGALNVIDVSSRINNSNPIGVIGTVGELQSSLKLVEILTQQIVSHFFVDRLLDLNNQTRMTLGEAQIRNELRADSLGMIYNRQLEEGLTPAIRRAIGILVEDGEFGVVKNTELEKKVILSGRKPIYIPSELIQADQDGEEVYNINYVSPAVRVLQSEELRGIMSTWQFAGTFGQAVPELLIRLDKDYCIKRIAELSGADSRVFLSDELFANEMQAYREAQAQNAQIETQKAAAEIAAKQGAAAQQNAQAQATQAGAIGNNGMGGGSMLL